MKVLFILQFVPYPLNSGGNQAAFNMIDRIRHLYDVSILFYLKSKDEEKAMFQLQTLWDNVTFYPFIPNHLKHHSKIAAEEALPDTLSYRFISTVHQSMERKMNRRIRKFRAKNNLLPSPNKMPDFVRENSCLNNDIPEFPAEFHNYVYEVSRKGFDLIQVEFYECLQLVYLLPKDAIKVFVQHEIRFVRNQNELDLFKEKTPDDEYRFLVRKDFELSLLSHYDKVIALTETDKQIMLSEKPGLDIYVSPAIVSKQLQETTTFKTAKDFVFIGNGLHFPNADGVMWFCESIVPLLIRKGKMQKLYIVGEWGKGIQKQIENIYPEACFTGFVDDLTSFISGKISIIPIRIGSGMRMKILDSVVASSPIVTTSKGCEGLPVTNEQNCLIADSPEEFAEALERLVDHPQKQEEIAANAQQGFATVFDFESQIQRRLDFYAWFAHHIKNAKS